MLIWRLDEYLSSESPSHEASRDSASSQHASPGIAGGAAELLLDADELVVFGQAVGARQRSGFDLTAIGGDGEVGDCRILGLARAMRDHRRIGGALRHLDGLQRLREGADLVELDQDRGVDALLDPLGKAVGVGPEAIIAA